MNEFILGVDLDGVCGQHTEIFREIVARELGVPCVTSATNATTLIPDGALIEVNGSSGTVTILE